MQAGKPAFAAQCHLSRGVSEAFLQKTGILRKLREVPWYEPATALAVSKPRGDDKCTND
jgi:hypothetical protein